MKTLASFIKHTIVGAIWFLIPLVVLGVVLSKAHEIAGNIIRPLADLIPTHSVWGTLLARLSAVIALVLFCFLAAAISKTSLAKKVIDWLEASFLEKLPGYGLLKSILESSLGVNEKGNQDVVLAHVEDALQVGFITEVLDNGVYAVYIPGAPIPWSGDLFFMTEDRFQRVNISYRSALKCVRQLGLGSNRLMVVKNIKPGL
jgi:uncharacterized membrane protein